MAKLAELLAQKAAAERGLYERYGFGDPGDLFEYLIAEATGGTLIPDGTAPGRDVQHPELGRIEVKGRRYPFDGRPETRVSLKGKEGGFDWLAHLVLDTGYQVVGAYLAPHDPVMALARRNRQRYVSLSAGAALAEARDLTEAVRAALQHL